LKKTKKILNDEIEDNKSKNNESKDNESKYNESKNNKSKNNESKDDKSKDNKNKNNKSKDNKSKDNKSKDDKSKDNESEDNDEDKKTMIRLKKEVANALGTDAVLVLPFSFLLLLLSTSVLFCTFPCFVNLFNSLSGSFFGSLPSFFKLFRSSVNSFVLCFGSPPYFLCIECYFMLVLDGFVCISGFVSRSWVAFGLLPFSGCLVLQCYASVSESE
jgi:hypothetical protein